jgi:hypothetical protein
MKLRNVHAELIALFEDALSAGFDEVVESDCELSHAVAEFVETEVDGRQGVCH